jgi:uncharacterized membrane protein
MEWTSLNVFSLEEDFYGVSSGFGWGILSLIFAIVSIVELAE